MPDPTRPWRKMDRSWLSSERLAKATDSAIVLFWMLVAVTDDVGVFHWTPARVRAMTAIRDWTPRQVLDIRSQLETLGIVSVDGDFVTVRRAAEYNGVPTSGPKGWVTPRLYQRQVSVGTAVDTAKVRDKYAVSTEYVQDKYDIPIGIEGNRKEGNIPPIVPLKGDIHLEKKQEPITQPSENEPRTTDSPAAPPATPRQRKHSTKPFLSVSALAAIHQDYDEALGPADVEFQVALALEHKAASKYTDWNRYVRNWLNKQRSQPMGPGLNGRAPSPPRTAGTRAAPDYDAEAQRVAAQKEV